MRPRSSESLQRPHIYVIGSRTVAALSENIWDIAQQNKYIHLGCLPSITIPLPVHHVSYIIHFVLAIVPCSTMLKVPQSIYSLFYSQLWVYWVYAAGHCSVYSQKSYIYSATVLNGLGTIWRHGEPYSHALSIARGWQWSHGWQVPKQTWVERAMPLSGRYDFWVYFYTFYCIIFRFISVISQCNLLLLGIHFYAIIYQ